MPSGSKKRKAARLKAQQQQSLHQIPGMGSCGKLSETGSIDKLHPWLLVLNIVTENQTPLVDSDGPGDSRMGALVASIDAACDGGVDMNAASKGKEPPNDSACLLAEPEESKMTFKHRGEGLLVISEGEPEKLCNGDEGIRVISGGEPEKICSSIMNDNGVISGPVCYDGVQTGHEQLCKAIVELQTRSNMPNKVSLASPGVLWRQDKLHSSGRDMVEATNIHGDNNGGKPSLSNGEGKTFVESMHRQVAKYGDAKRKPFPPDEQAKTSVESMDRHEVTRASDSDPTTALGGAVSEKIEEPMTNDVSISVPHKSFDYNIHAADSTSPKEYNIRTTSKKICEDPTMHAIVDVMHESRKEHDLEGSAAGDGGASHSDPSADVCYAECKSDVQCSLQTNEPDGERERSISETMRPSSQQLEIGLKWWGCCGLLDMWQNRH